MGGKGRVVGYPGLDDGDELRETEERHVTRLLAAYALGALDPEEMEQVARHIGQCERCRNELDGYENVTGLLAYAAPPQPVPVRARAALLARIDEIGTPNREKMILLEGPRRQRPSLWPPSVGWSVPARRYAMFGAIPAVIILAIVLVMGEIINEQQAEIRTVQNEKNDGNRILVSIDDPRYMTEFVTIPDIGGNARGRVLIDREANTAMIVAIDLPEIGDDQTFVAWFRFHDQHEYARAGTLTVDDMHRAQLILEPVSPIGTYESLVITIEDTSDGSIPRGPEIMTAGMYPENLQVVP